MRPGHGNLRGSVWQGRQVRSVCLVRARESASTCSLTRTTETGSLCPKTHCYTNLRMPDGTGLAYFTRLKLATLNTKSSLPILSKTSFDPKEGPLHLTTMEIPLIRRHF